MGMSQQPLKIWGLSQLGMLLALEGRGRELPVLYATGQPPTTKTCSAQMLKVQRSRTLMHTCLISITVPNLQ